MRGFGYFGLVVVAVVSISAQPALAYFDPSSGSMAVQGLVAFFSGAAVAIGMYLGRIRAVFSGLRAKLRPRNAD